jgi:hypothetical protein
VCHNITNIVVFGVSLHESSTVHPEAIIGIMEQILWIIQGIAQIALFVAAFNSENEISRTKGLAHVMTILLFLNFKVKNSVDQILYANSQVVFLFVGVGIFDQSGGDLAYMYNPAAQPYLGVEFVASRQDSFNSVRAITSPAVIGFRLLSRWSCVVVLTLAIWDNKEPTRSQSESQSEEDLKSAFSEEDLKSAF